MFDNFHFTNFLVPALVTGLLGISAAMVKTYEYAVQFGTRKIDLLMWVAILTRLGLGFVYLVVPPDPITERSAELRLLITLLLLVDTLRGLRWIVVRRKALKAFGYLEALKSPTSEDQDERHEQH